MELTPEAATHIINFTQADARGVRGRNKNPPPQHSFTRKSDKHFIVVASRRVKSLADLNTEALVTQRMELLRNSSVNSSCNIDLLAPKPKRQRRKNTGHHYSGLMPPPAPRGDANFALHSPARTPKRQKLPLLYLDSPGRNLTEIFASMAVESTQATAGTLDRDANAHSTPFSPLTEYVADMPGGCGSELDNEVEPFFKLPLPTAPANPIKFQVIRPGEEALHLENGGPRTEAESARSKTIRIADDYYSQVVAHHAPREIPDVCEDCHKAADPKGGEQLFTCSECTSMKWYCRGCIIARHKENPLHEVQDWDEARGSLRNHSLVGLGLVVGLYHEDGKRCPNEGKGVQLTVLHTTGIRQMAYAQCMCRSLGSTKRRTARPAQLVANRLFPATHQEPTTAFTFEALRMYDVLNLEGHINVKQYCDGLLSLSPRKYRESLEAGGDFRTNFHNAVRQWRLFRIMETYGYTSYQDVIDYGVVEECGGCPIPGVNMPANWEEHPQADLLSMKMINGDGNFHMTQQSRAKGIIADPSLFGDFGFWVPEETGQKYVKAAEQLKTGKLDSGSCETQAGTASRERPRKNCAVSGIYAMMCDHGMYLPHGVIDFVKGERYSAVDVPFQMQLQKSFSQGLKRIVFMYDIACKFNVNAYVRCIENPHSPLEPRYREHLRKELGRVLYKVNNFHIKSHKAECADLYGLNYTPLVGMRAGEEIETGWPHANREQYSTREMGAGARRDALTVHMLHMNMNKKNAMGSRLLKRFSDAVDEAEEHQGDLESLEQTLNQHDEELVTEFKRSYTEMGGEQFRANAARFQYPTKAKMFSALKDAEVEKRGNRTGASATLLLADKGIDADRAWDLIQHDTNPKNYRKKMDLETKVAEHCSQILAQFPYLKDESLFHTGVALGSSYYLPNKTDPEFQKYCEQELDLRIGLGHELLQELRTVTSVLHGNCKVQKWSRGVDQMQATAKAQDRAVARRDKAASDYRYNWKKIECLLTARWLSSEEKARRLRGLQKLNPEDIKFYLEPGTQTRSYMGELQENASWIWQVAMFGTTPIGSGGYERALQEWVREARRLKWVHCFASAERWKEEVLRVTEEILRFGAWHNYKIQHYTDAVARASLNDGSWISRGREALQRELLEEWTDRRDRHPKQLRGE